MYYVIYNIYVGLDIYKKEDLDFTAPNFHKENDIKCCGSLKECLKFFKEYY